VSRQVVDPDSSVGAGGHLVFRLVVKSLRSIDRPPGGELEICHGVRPAAGPTEGLETRSGAGSLARTCARAARLLRPAGALY
jgi:hypothetical protein